MKRGAQGRRWPRPGIRLKYTLFLAGLLAVALGILSLLVLRGVENNQRAAMEADLERHVRTANLRVKQAYYTGIRLEPQPFIRQRGRELAADLGAYTGLAVTLYDAEGRQVGSSLEGGPPGEMPEPLGYALQDRIAYQSAGDYLHYFAPLQGPDGNMGVLRLQYPLRGQQAFMRQLEQLFLLAGGVALLCSFAAGFAYFSRSAAAIARLDRAAGEIRSSRYLQAPPLKRRDELGELASSLYYMSAEIERHIAAKDEERRKLELAVGKLQALEQRQKQYIGDISHEFKTPLTAIMAYLELLDMYRDDPQLLEEARTNISKEAQRLYEMVEKVLRLSALEKYDFESQAELLDVPAVLADISGRLRGKAERFGLKLDVDAAPAELWIDRDSFTLIIVNLLDNAIKYNQPGGSVSVRCREERGMVRISVADTGIGIPGEAQERIFEPFFTVNKDRSRASGGTGLGLALVRNLARKQGGEVTLLSSGEQGSVFEAAFPSAQPT